MPVKPTHVPWTWIALGLGVLTIVCAWWFLPVSEWIHRFQQWITGLGPIGPLLFALAYILGAVFFAPETPLSIAGGLAFGAWAIPLVLCSATLGASLAFLVARHIARHHVERLLQGRPKFEALHQALKEEGWKVVLLLRLSPVVPFNVQNYFFGVTNISFSHYTAATAVGIVPGTCLYVYIGMVGEAATSGESMGMLRWAFLGLGLLATVLVTILISRTAKARLEKVGEKEAGGQPCAR